MDRIYLWYVCVWVLLHFIQVEHTGDWNLYIHAISETIPIFHAAGHLAYSKSAHLYLDNMKKLLEVVGEDKFR